LRLFEWLNKNIKYNKMRQRKKKGGAQPEEFYLFFSDQMLPLELPTDDEIKEFTEPPVVVAPAETEAATKKLAGGKNLRKKGGADEDEDGFKCPICFRELNKKDIDFIGYHGDIDVQRFVLDILIDKEGIKWEKK
jgi:hypothetical protein